MIPVVCLTAIGSSVFFPLDTLNINYIVTMLLGLSTGIVYTANLILIKRFVASKIRKNAIAVSCAFRLSSVLIMPWIKDQGNVDVMYQGSILIGLALLSGVLIICCEMKKSKDRVWDEYYESYFERHSKTISQEPQSVFYIIRYFLVVLGMRVPELLINNNVTKAVQLGFLERFSPTVASYSFITTIICILLLLMTAFNHPSSRNPAAVKYFIIPASYFAFVIILTTVPLIHLYLVKENGFILMAIILMNFLLEIVFFGGLFYLLDTLLVQSDLSNVKISLIIVLEVVLSTIIERLLIHKHLLALITIEGYYSIVTIFFLVPIFLFHRELEK